MRAHECEKSRRLSVFHVQEDGAESYLQVDRGLEFLDAAKLLHSYLSAEHGAVSFTQELYDAEVISADRFRQMAELRMENTGEVTGAFELDFDAQTVSALHIMDGWMVYPMKDISEAACFAQQKQNISEEERWTNFLERLDGKELTADTLSEQTPPQIEHEM